MLASKRRSREQRNTRIASEPHAPTPEYLSRSQGEDLLDRQARKHLNMTGDEFRRRYQSGQLRSSENRTVERLSYLLSPSEKE